MSPEGSTVLFLRASKTLPRRELIDFARTLQMQVADGRRFTTLITDDKELRRLNGQFLGKDYATDVLSFPEEDGSGFLGELAISWQRAAEQAPEFQHGTGDEIKILMLHGLLHLLGMDHEAKDRGKMARAEKRWRKELGLPAGLIERVRA